MPEVTSTSQGSNQGPKFGQERRVKILLLLLALLAATLVFLSTSMAERMFGFKLTNLFSDASRQDLIVEPEPTQKEITSKSEICAYDPCGPTEGPTVFNCIQAPCLNPNLSILNPNPKSQWLVGDTYPISWDGAAGQTATVTIEPFMCEAFKECLPRITIASNIKNTGTVEWKIPTDISPLYLDGLSRITVMLDSTYYNTTVVSIVRAIGQTGTGSPNGSYVYFTENPRQVYRIEGGKLRPLPFPAEQVIACLGHGPTTIVIGNQRDRELAKGEPIFCNPQPGTVGQYPTVLRSGFPDSPVGMIYLIEKGNRRPFPSDKIFECLGFSYKDVYIATKPETQLPIGPAMTCEDTQNPLQLLGTTLPHGVINVTYNAKVTATGGVAPYTYLIRSVQRANSSGLVIPPVLSSSSYQISIDNEGQITGKFSEVGYYLIEVQASSRNNQSNRVVRSYLLYVGPTGSTGPGGVGGIGGASIASQNCVDNSPESLTALYRFYSRGDNDHYYSTSSSTPRGFVAEGITAYVYSRQVPGTVPMYQSYNSALKDHYYTTVLADTGTYGYKLDGIVGYIYPSQVTGSSAMYRMYNQGARHYMMTTSTVERDVISGIGFALQGVVGYVCGASRPGSEVIPVYRLWNSRITDHFYTVDIFERDAVLKRGYVDEGIVGHVYSVPGANRVPVYRLWSQRFTNHFYTTSEDEAAKSGYNREGILGFISIVPSNQAVQLYRLYNPRISNHFYTTSSSERDAAVRGGYRFEGTMGYLP